MFRRRSRLTREDIAEVTTRGQSISTPYFSLKALPFEDKTLKNKAISQTKGAGQARFAFVMSKKEEKTAPGRNRAKRRLRAAARACFPGLKPYNIMVFIRKSALKVPYGDIKESLRGALQRFY